MSERLIVLLIAGVQFVNVLDFMMIMPMGPDLARSLSLPQSKLPTLAAAYALAAAVSGFAGLFFLDRFDRRTVLSCSLLGLATGTSLASFATGYSTLLMARMVAGAFGGPATSVAWAVIADVIPPERRGRAAGVVMTSVSVSQVLGVPLGLELAQRFGWRATFGAIAAFGMMGCLAAFQLLPKLEGHRSQASIFSLGFLKRSSVQISLAMTGVVMMGGFILIPNISAFVQGNLGLPRESLKYLYLVGGAFSFLSMNVAGRAVDRFGSFRVGLMGVGGLLLFIYLFFVQSGLIHPLLGFPVFMVMLSFRNVAYNTLTSKVPAPAERARFQSLQSVVQHASSAFGAFVSSRLLTEATLPVSPGVSRTVLVGMPKVAWVSMALSTLVPWMMWQVERRVRRTRDGFKVETT